MTGLRMLVIFFSVLVLASSEKTNDDQPNIDIITVIKEMKTELRDVKEHVKQQEVKDNATQQVLKMLIHQNTEMKSTLDDLAKEVKTIKTDAKDAKTGVDRIQNDVCILRKEVKEVKEVKDVSQIKLDVATIKSVLTKRE